MIINMDGFEISLDKLMDSFARLFQDLGLDETHDEQVYNTVMVFIASIIASSLQEAYEDDPAQLEEQLKETCNEIAGDLEEKIRAFL